MYKYLFPIFIFTIGIVIFLYFHVFVVGDFCFYGSLCKCNNFGIFIYTIIKESLQYHSIFVLLLYLFSEYITDSFLENKFLKRIYLFLQLMPLIVVPFFYFQNAKEAVSGTIRKIMYLTYVFLNSSFVLLVLIISKKISRKFIGRILILLLTFSYFYFHSYVFKSILF